MTCVPAQACGEPHLPWVGGWPPPDLRASGWTRGTAARAAKGPRSGRTPAAEFVGTIWNALLRDGFGPQSGFTSIPYRFRRV
jgi:hypothetical protein